jgi:hypothetical protein
MSPGLLAELYTEVHRAVPERVAQLEQRRVASIASSFTPIDLIEAMIDVLGRPQPDQAVVDFIGRTANFDKGGAELWATDMLEVEMLAKAAYRRHCARQPRGVGIEQQHLLHRVGYLD